jgi:hypothetical protein
MYENSIYTYIKLQTFSPSSMCKTLLAPVIILQLEADI